MRNKLLIGFLVIMLVLSNNLVVLAGEIENTIEMNDLEGSNNVVEKVDSIGRSNILEDKG